MRQFSLYLFCTSARRHVGGFSTHVLDLAAGDRRAGAVLWTAATSHGHLAIWRGARMSATAATRMLGTTPRGGVATIGPLRCGGQSIPAIDFENRVVSASKWRLWAAMVLTEARHARRLEQRTSLVTSVAGAMRCQPRGARPSQRIATRLAGPV